MPTSTVAPAATLTSETTAGARSGAVTSTTYSPSPTSSRAKRPSSAAKLSRGIGAVAGAGPRPRHDAEGVDRAPGFVHDAARDAAGRLQDEVDPRGARLGLALGATHPRRRDPDRVHAGRQAGQDVGAGRVRALAEGLGIVEGRDLRVLDGTVGRVAHPAADRDPDLEGHVAEIDGLACAAHVHVEAADGMTGRPHLQRMGSGPHAQHEERRRRPPPR